MSKNFNIYISGNTTSYHIEKLFNTEQVDALLENLQSYYNEDYNPTTNFLIISNDNYKSKKYSSVINEDEFKMLCGLNFNDQKTTINNKFYHNFNKEIYEKFCDIKQGKIISFTYEEKDNQILKDDEDLEFLFFKTPKHYKNNVIIYDDDTDEEKKRKSLDIFYYEKFKKITYSYLTNYLHGILILEIDNDYYPEDANWIFKNNFLRYFCKKNKVFICISIDKLKEIKRTKTREISFKIKSKINKEHYIEYYITDFFETQEVVERGQISNDNHPAQSYDDWLNEEFGDDAETAYWNLD